MNAKVWIPILLLLVGLGIGLFMVDFPRASDDQMAPAVRKGDLLLACRVCGAPQRGDVVLFTPPDAPGSLSVRRVLGVPGDKVEVRKGVLLLNGSPIEGDKAEEVHLQLSDGDTVRERVLKTTIERLGAHRYPTFRDVTERAAPEVAAETLTDTYFLASDVRSVAHDSRDYGAVQRAQIRSRILRVLNAADGDSARQIKLP